MTQKARRYRTVPPFLASYDAAMRWVGRHRKRAGYSGWAEERLWHVEQATERDEWEERAGDYSAFAKEAYRAGLITVYRAVRLAKSHDGTYPLDLQCLGKSWSRFRQSAGVYGWAPGPGDELLIVGRVRPSDVDWEFGFHSFLYYGTDQWEVSLLEHTPVEVERVEVRSRSGGEGRWTADGQWIEIPGPLLVQGPILGSTGPAVEEWAAECGPKWREQRERKVNPVVSNLDTPEGQAWFGNSVVVDSEGRPLVVYHGTSKTFDEFIDWRPVFFTHDRDYAEGYTGPKATMPGKPVKKGRARIIAAHLSIQRPFDPSRDPKATAFYNDVFVPDALRKYPHSTGGGTMHGTSLAPIPPGAPVSYFWADLLWSYLRRHARERGYAEYDGLLVHEGGWNEKDQGHKSFVPLFTSQIRVLPLPAKRKKNPLSLANPVRSDRDYMICSPSDGRLYVEVPSFAHLSTLLLSQRFRRKAHFRTQRGYVPYHGGGIAFDAHALALRGVRPVWYLRRGGSYQLALEQLVADGVYEDERTAEQLDGQASYASECEWIGPEGMRFAPRAIAFAWYDPRKTSREELLRLRSVFPTLDLRDEPPHDTDRVREEPRRDTWPV